MSPSSGLREDVWRQTVFTGITDTAVDFVAAAPSVDTPVIVDEEF